MTAAFSMQFTADAEVTHADGTTDSGTENADTQED
jgi:hypothetical protein